MLFFLFIKESWEEKKSIMVSRKLLNSRTLFNIDIIINVSWAPNQHIRMIYLHIKMISFDTEYWSKYCLLKIQE